MPASLVIDCLGDSLTAGVVSPTYPRLLKQLLVDHDHPDAQVNNRGKNGFTVGDYLELQRSRTASMLMRNRKIDYTVLILGGNDTRSTKRTPIDVFERQYNELIDLVEGQTHPGKSPPTLLLGNVPGYNGPVEIFWQGETHVFDAADRIREEINPCIERIARQRNLTCIDIYTPLAEAGPGILPDGIHPDARGNEILARTVWEALQPKLSLRD